MKEYVCVKTDLPGKRSKELFEKRKKYVASGISSCTKIFIDEAKGALLKDIDGNIFVDFAAGIGVQNVGHCADEVVDAIKEQAEKYIHPCFHVAMYEPYVNLAEKLSKLTSRNFERKVMFANSGAEAVENSIKLARKYTGKTMILSLEDAFHGRTYMAMTLTSKVKPYKYGFGPLCADTYKIPSGYCYRCPLSCKYPECGIACAERLRTLLKGELAPDMIAALIAEPVQGEGGFIVQPKEYLQALESICRENGIVFIIDEIQSGFARTGKMFAYFHFNIEPDLITMAKSIAAGLPLSAVVGKEEIMDAPLPGQIGGTYGGNPLACVAGLKVIEIIEKKDLTKKANILGNILMNRLSEMKDKYDCVGDVRGIGSMLAIEFVKDRYTKEPDSDIVMRIIKYAFNKGVIFINAGIFGNVIRLLPPLVMTEEEANYGMDVLDEAIGNSIVNL